MWLTIWRFYGIIEDTGLVIAETKHGDLQGFLDRNPIAHQQRIEFCVQVAEAVSYVHSHGIIHSDLRLDQFLVDENSQGDLNIRISDFGGSDCEALSIDGNRLPDDPYFDPREAESGRNIDIDIFSLGTILYTIMNGHLPHRSAIQSPADESFTDYQHLVNSLFQASKFPDLANLCIRNVVEGCWERHYRSVPEVETDLRSSATACIESIARSGS